MAHFDWNDGWLFTPVFTPALCGVEYSGPALEPVRIPHTVRPLPFNYCDEKAGQLLSGYRREFDVPPDWEGRPVLLTFEGVAHDATVFCNGLRVAHHSCGYTAFTANLSPALRYGRRNVVTVRCDSRDTLDIPPFGAPADLLPCGGIYRGVSLDVKESSYLRDVFLQAEADGSFRLYSVIEGETVGCSLRALFRNASGRTAVYSGSVALPLTGTLNGARPWTPERPNLYTVTVQLVRQSANGLPERVLDEKQFRFGFRTLTFTAEGLFLNGRRVQLRGLNRRQSYPYQGDAMPDSIQRLDAWYLKNELGCNAVRTDCCPPSPAFLDACDELGLLVYIEPPGWRHIGGAAWQAQALQNVREMVTQCRNHPSVFLWGVRIPDSPDDDVFYKRLNEAVRRLDPTRPTAGTRRHRKSSLLEDVYAYDESSQPAHTGIEPPVSVTPDPRKGYLVASYGGAQLPAKSFDDEAHRLGHALHFAAQLNAVAARKEIAGSFGSCMADYNTGRAFGSGDRICYHGVTDAFRNQKLTAALMASQKPARVPSDVVLAVSSSMDGGDQPGAAPGVCWAFTNADSVRMYRNDVFIAEFSARTQPHFRALAHPPILINDFVGSQLEKGEGLPPAAAAQIAEYFNQLRSGGLPPSAVQKARLLGLLRTLRMSWDDCTALYRKYVGEPGGEAASYRFEAVWRGRVTRTVVREPVETVRLECIVQNPVLTDGPTWDCAAVRLRAVDQNGNVLPYCGEAVQLSVEGPVRLLGPACVPLRGGMAGTYLATVGQAGRAVLRARMEGAPPVEAVLTVRLREGLH